MQISVQKRSNAPFYKQIVEFVTAEIRSGRAKTGDILPSMNELAEQLDISRETVKKAYSILRNQGYLEARQGKGFFVAEPAGNRMPQILLLFDVLSPYKEILYRSFAAHIGDNARTVIRLHNQNADLLKYYLDEALDRFDYYVITPHFPLDTGTQRKVLRQLKRVPNRKLIMLDHWMKSLPGNYGAVYQDFDNDICDGLGEALDDLRKFERLNVVTLSSSLYHKSIKDGVTRFCKKNRIQVRFYDTVSDEMVRSGEVYLLLNSQLNSQLNQLVHTATDKGYEIGRDISIISYNDAPFNELVLGGLTTVSADFAEMGRIAADMILDNSQKKVKCDFRMIRRKTF